MKKNSFVEGTVFAYIAILLTKIIGAIYVIPFYNHATFLSYHEHLHILTFTSGIARGWLKKSAVYDPSFSQSVALLKERRIITTSQKYIKTNEQNP